jgi:uncharacterized membrane protein
METEEYARLLLAPLYGEPATRSTVDIRRAVAEGRRRRRSRQVLGYAAIAVLTALALAGLPAADRLLPGAGPVPKGGSPTAAGSPTVAAPSETAPPEQTAPAKTPPEQSSPATGAPPAPTTCTLARLPIPPDHNMGLVTGADPTGRYLLGRAYPGPYQVLIWDNGRQIKVDVPGTDQSLRDINSGGTAVGVSYTDRVVPWVYHDGKVSPLPGVTSGEARGINEAGVIVGARSNSAGDIPVRWASLSSAAMDLPLPSKGDWRGLAFDVDEDGTVVGTLRPMGSNDDADHAYVWPPGGTPRELPVPIIDGARATMSRAFTIRYGWVTGFAQRGNTSVAVRWNVHTSELRTFPQFWTRASTANRYGWQVGTAPNGQAVFLSDSGLVTLPDLAGHRQLYDNIATSVSDDGRTIGGQADDRNDVIQAVVWRCT